MWDVAIVGGGPAGAAAALAVRQRAPDASVVLLDREAFPRDKACGDGIAPHALDVLADLGVTGVVDGSEPVHRLRLGFPTGPTVLGSMRRPAYVVPRLRFDAALVAAAQGRGVELVEHRVRDVSVTRDRVVLDGTHEARVVVAADGAGSRCRRALGLAPNASRHTAVAIRGYAPVVAGRENEQSIVFGRHGWPAYAWSFPVGDGTANVGYGEVLTPGRTLSKAHMQSELERLLPGATDAAIAWRAHHLPLSTSRPRQPDGRVLLAGDALSLVNPVTGEGIYYAVRSGVLAGQVAARVKACSSGPGAEYRAALRRALGQHLRHTTLTAALARTHRVVSAGVRAAQRDEACFDDLVELGLGSGLLTRRVVRGLVREVCAGPSGA